MASFQVNMTMANYHNSHSGKPPSYLSRSVLTLCKSDRFFDEAKTFRPERWLPRDAGGSAGLHVKNAYQAFSFGPRNCVGRLLAMTELRLILAKMVWHFDIELANDVGEFLETAKFFVS